MAGLTLPLFFCGSHLGVLGPENVLPVTGGLERPLVSRAQRCPVERVLGLQLDRLNPGNYVLEVTVTDEQGRKDQRLQPFQVLAD